MVAMEGPTLFETVVVEQGVRALAPHGFSLWKSSPTHVRFASPHAFVEFFVDQKSLEVGAIVGLPGADHPRGRVIDENQTFSIGRQQEENAFSLEQVLKYDEAQASKLRAVGSFVLEDIATLPSAFSLLLQTLLDYGGPFLKGDIAAFARLGDRVSSAAEALTRKMREEDLRRQAERAWQVRDYARVASSFSKCESQLSPAEEAKLRYALRHLDQR